MLLAKNIVDIFVAYDNTYYYAHYINEALNY
jgi:hypothetical protein